MEEIVAKLLTESGYIKRNPTDTNPCDSYINRELHDCIIVCDYDIENLTNFKNSKKTKQVMDIFEETRTKEDIFKNTSLIITVKLNQFSDYELIKNIVLSVEENPYAFRKYVALYTKNGISGIDTNTDIKPQLETILLDADRFKDFEEGNTDDEFRTVTDLFIKLPFMSIRSMPAIELEDFSSPMDEPENKELTDIYASTAHVFEDSQNLSPEEQIDMLLQDELIDNFAKTEDGDEV